MRFATLFIAFISVLLFSSCEQRPDYVLSKSKMKQVLYDYHLAQAMIDRFGADDPEKTRQYIDAVFANNGITEAEFDSSLIWYNAHAEDLRDIYESLKKRYTAENEKMQLSTGNSEMAAIITEGGDTTNLWHGASLLVLRDNDMLNKETFTIKADTSFRPHDRFIMLANVHFMRSDNNDRTTHVTCGLTVRDAAGQTMGQTQQTSLTGSVKLDLTHRGNKAPASISGFFYYEGSDKIRNFCMIDNIQLVRMHTSQSVADTTSVMSEEARRQAHIDSINADTSRLRHGPRLSPEQLRRQTQDVIRQNAPTNTRIKIKAAPDVRTPNSVGPTRRKPKTGEKMKRADSMK